MCFAPRMSSIPRVTSKMKSIRLHSDEGRRDSDEIEQEEGQEVECHVAEESHSPPISSCKLKSEGGTSDSG